MTDKTWRMAIAGECMTVRPFSMYTEPEFLKVRELLTDADITYAHLEMNFGEFSKVGAPAKAKSTASYMLTDPQIAQELRWLGIDLLSTAHNHSMDFGAAGLTATVEACRAAGIGHAGTGIDLEEAREPFYRETAKGRTALISTSSGNSPHEWASMPKGTMPGRPGVNPLRVNSRYLVDEPAATQLKDIAKKLGVLQLPDDKASTGPFTLGEKEFRVILPGDPQMRGSGVFADEGRFGIEMTASEFDVTANLRMIDEARSMADFVMVAHHFSVAEGKRGSTPPQFVVDFAHRAIDAGADVFLGHGWHRTLGIEIYKGKPIFYGLGNFFAQSEFLRRVPYDSFESWGHDLEKLVTLTPNAHPLHPGLGESSQTWWSSAIAHLDFDADGQIVGIELSPVELGRDVTPQGELHRRTGSGDHDLTEGRPLLASGTNAEAVIGRLADLSKPFGTELSFDGKIGRWRA